MALEVVYDKKEDIPEGFDSLYTERDGKFHLTGINGIKTQEDIDRLQTSLQKERHDHKETRQKLRAFDGLDPTEAREKLDEYPALKEFYDNKGDVKEQVENLVTKRLQAATAPLQREVEGLKRTNTELSEENSGLKNTLTSSKRDTLIRRAARAAKVADTAIDDILVIAGNHFEFSGDNLITKDGAPIPPGLDPNAYFAEMQKMRPHWWPQTAGGGAGGGGPAGGYTENPWSREHWNMTKQGQIFRENADKAEKMAKAAGTKIGGKIPPKK